MDLKALLNKEQYEGAVTVEGPVLILAGAGSGKTRVLTYRMAHMFCAGMIAGEGLVGILLAVFAVFGISTALSIDLGNIGGVVLMIVMIACLLAFSMKKKKN